VKIDVLLPCTFKTSDKKAPAACRIIKRKERCTHREEEETNIVPEAR